MFSRLFDVCVAVLFIFYSSMGPAQLRLHDKSDTTPLLRVCESVCEIRACFTTCAEAFFVVRTAAYSKADVYSHHSFLPATFSLLTETNVVLILIF